MEYWENDDSVYAYLLHNINIQEKQRIESTLSNVSKHLNNLAQTLNQMFQCITQEFPPVISYSECIASGSKNRDAIADQLLINIFSLLSQMIHPEEARRDSATEALNYFTEQIIPFFNKT